MTIQRTRREDKGAAYKSMICQPHMMENVFDTDNECTVLKLVRHADKIARIEFATTPPRSPDLSPADKSIS